MRLISLLSSLGQKADFSFIVRLTSLTLLVVLGLSWRVYFPDSRFYAPAPLLPLLGSGALPYLFGIKLLALTWLLLKPQHYVFNFIVVAAITVSVLMDVLIFQPYIYMYGFTLLIAGLCHNRFKTGIDALRIMVSGVYFWAGFHKLNLTFYATIFPWFVAPFHDFNAPGNAVMDALFALALFSVPVFEAAIGVLLLIPRYRMLATLMALTMLVVVLACLGPLGHDWAKIVWPWNIYLFLLEARLFLPREAGKGEPFTFGKITGVSAVLFFLAPALAMISPWYYNPGFKLYSGNIMQGEVLLAKQETLEKAPSLKPYVTDHKLSLIRWTVNELGHAPIAVPYALKAGAEGVCPYLNEPQKAIFRLHSAPLFYTVKTEQQDEPLCP